MITELCDKCYNSIFFCHCEEKYFHIDKLEAKQLYDYFLKVGYISYEDYEHIHKFIDRLKEFIDEKEISKNSN